MATTYHGESLVQLPTVATWKVGTGGRTTLTFKGKEADIQGKTVELQLAGYETEVTTGPVWTLVATINIDLIGNPSNNEPEPIPTWELVPHSIEQGIFESGRPFISSVPAEVRSWIEGKLKNPNIPTIAYVPKENVNDLDLTNKAVRIYNYKQMGADAVQKFSYSLKRSILVSNNYNLKWSQAYNGKVFSSGGVLNITDPPNSISSIVYSLPSGDASETVFVDGYAAPAAGAMNIPFFYGWLQQAASYQTVGNNRTQISQEWIYNKWLVGPDGFYDLA